jgi:hypothetical protein
LLRDPERTPSRLSANQRLALERLIRVRAKSAARQTLSLIGTYSGSLDYQVDRLRFRDLTRTFVKL